MRLSPKPRYDPTVRFDDAFLDELKSRLRLSDVIGRTVKLKRQGREYAGLSPFSKERTPSFFVNDDKGFFHDFSSGKHGDLIAFLQETERLSFVEAVERLAAEAGMALPQPDARAAETDKKLRGLADWMELAAAWFEAELLRPSGQAARAYLERRGLPPQEWKRFRLGYAPAGRTALKDYLVAKGGRVADLVEAGLLIAPEDGASPYDRFRDRIIFPIEGSRERIISFGGRALDPQARAKYLNGPESPLFHKGRALYGLAEARRLLHAGGQDAPLVAVEGYMDVIACQRAGVAAVAPMGTALTEDQMEALWRLNAEPTLCFDGDRAGRAAAFRAIERAFPLLKPGRSLKFASLALGKDPDDVLRDEGASALVAQLSRTRPMSAVLFEKEATSGPLDTPEQIDGLRRRLTAIAETIQDADLRRSYRSQFQAAVSNWVRQLDADRRAAKRGRTTFDPLRPQPLRQGTRDAVAQASSVDPISASLCKYALQDPAVLEDNLEALQSHGLGDPALGDLIKEIIRLLVLGSRLDTEGLQRHLARVGFSALLNDVDRAAAKSSAPFWQSDVTLAAARSKWSQAFAVVSRRAALEVATNAAKEELAAGAGNDRAFEALKGERDSLRRAMRTGTIWDDDGSN
jgi:DNA primase